MVLLPQLPFYSCYAGIVGYKRAASGWVFVLLFVGHLLSQLSM